MATSSDSVVTHSVGDQTASEELDLEDAADPVLWGAMQPSYPRSSFAAQLR